MTDLHTPQNAANARALVLLDRDGCLITEEDYLGEPERVRLESRAARAVALLEEQNIARVLTTNQAGVGKGLFTEEQMHAVNARMEELLAAEGAHLNGVYSCTHHPEATDPAHRTELHRRKPSPGMAEDAVRDLGLDGKPIYAIGDRESDVELGENAGGKGILVRTGYGRKAEISMRAAKKHCPVASDVYEAVRLVLADLIKAECPQDPAMKSKFKTLGQLHDIVATAKRAKRRVVLANGCFDLLHGGHVSFLEASRAAGDLLILAVNSNASIRRLKGAQRPLLRESERLQLLAGLQCVDYLTVFYTDAADEVLEEIHPDIHAKGTDYTSDRVPERQTAIRLGIETYIAGAPKENSTRDIIDVVVERAKAGSL